MGTVKNTWLAINFFMGYLNPTQPASEYVSSLLLCNNHPTVAIDHQTFCIQARQSIADGFQELFK